jgi:N-acetylmuramoyl-L-alanine amidase CwlA
MEEILDYFGSIHNQKVLIKPIIVYAWQGNYPHTLMGSLSSYLFEPLSINENLAKPNNTNLKWVKKEKVYICVHDTGCGVHNAREWNDAVVNQYVDGDKYSASFQYVVGNDAIYRNIPDDIIGYHAGDGYEIDYNLIDSGVEFNGIFKPNITISYDGFYEIDGKKSLIKAPMYLYKINKNDETFNERIAETKDINDEGIRTIVKDGKYFLGETYFNTYFNKISNRGGNVNSIGIESCVNRGSDIYYTWMKDAKLIAYLMDKYNLTIDDVVPHHYFSGKDCPMTMRHSKMYKHVKNLSVIEFNILKFIQKGYKISFYCNNKEYVSDNGKVIKIPKRDLMVNYYITVEKDGFVKIKKFTSKIIGMKNILKRE